MNESQRGSLLAASLGLTLVLLDVSVVNVALDALLHQFSTDVAGLQWVVNGYTLCFAAFLLTGGMLGDRFGVRKIFSYGVSIFSLASLGCGLASTLEVLIASRIAQGIGAALLVPSSLGMLQLAFPDIDQRSRAVGWWAAIGGLSMAAGPVLGGLLVSHTGWRSIFLINLPFGLLALYLTYRYVKHGYGHIHGNLDWPGQIAVILALVCFTVALTEAGRIGLAHVFTISALMLAMVFGIAFLWIQASSKAPMLPLILFRTPTLVAASVAGVIVNFSYYGLIFVFSLFFQVQQHFSAQQTGFAFLPMTLILVVMNILAGRLVRRVGKRNLMTTGFLIAASGYSLLLSVDVDGDYSDLVIPMLLAASGMALIVPTMVNAALCSVPPSHAGVASGLLNTARQVGGIIGVAAFGFLVSDTQTDAFMQGMHLSLCLSVMSLIFGAVISWRWIERR